MTERTPLTSTAVPQYDPQYVFNAGRIYRNRVRQFQCCVCATVLACFIVALVVTVAYSVNHDTDDIKNSTNNSADDILVTLLSLQFPLPDPDYMSWSDNDTSPAELEQALNVGLEQLRARDRAEETGPHLQPDSPSYRHQMAVRTYPEATRLSRAGYIMDVASQHLVASCRMNATQKSIVRGPTVAADWMPDEACADDMPSSCTVSPYRSADGSCNNPVHPYKWGVAMRPFRRTLPPHYGDGVSTPRLAKDGSALPSARDVSVTVHRPMYHDDPHFTVMLAVWGQFIDHDITATALNVGSNGGAISCCGTQSLHPECFPVLLDMGDPYFHQFNMTCMEFVRSAPAPMCTLGPREQLNQVSSYLDGSVVYGSNLNLTMQLRSLQGGRLRMSVTPDGRTLLPYSSDPSDGCNQEKENARGRYCFISGDARANENLHLTTMHLLWARQHNLVADKLTALNPTWTDERVFQEARRIIVAQLQHITYSEFLPVLLGDELMSQFQLKPHNYGYFHGYDATVEPSVANSFAAAAFRFGHTLLPGLMKMINNGSEEYVELHRMLFNPYSLYNAGRLDATLKGAMATQVEKVDPYFTTELTEHLFARGAMPCGLDLVSLNIQRGRDHGLPSYPAWREKCGLSRPTSFSEMTEYINADALRRMSELYKSVDDIDLYTGALAERPISGAFIGPTITCLIVDQFLRLKLGDRFWYESPEFPQAFSNKQLKELRKSTLAKIICDNADSVEFVQAQVMRTVGPGNYRVPCTSIPEPDLNEWKEPARVALYTLVSRVRTLPARLGGKVISAHVFSDGNKLLWSGTLPLAIPAEQNIRPNWNGIVHGSSLEGIFSLPIRGQWLNGRFSFQLSLSWNQTQDSKISGIFTSPVYFKEVTQEINPTSEIVEFQEELSTHPSISAEQFLPTAQIVLEGAFSRDRKAFWWNGGFVITVPSSQLPVLDEETQTSNSNVPWFDMEGTIVSEIIKTNEEEALQADMEGTAASGAITTNEEDASQDDREYKGIITTNEENASRADMEGKGVITTNEENASRADREYKGTITTNEENASQADREYKGTITTNEENASWADREYKGTITTNEENASRADMKGKGVITTNEEEVLWIDMEGTVVSGAITRNGEELFVWRDENIPLSLKVATPIIIKWNGSITNNSSRYVTVQGVLEDSYFLFNLNVSTALNSSIAGAFRSPVHFTEMEDTLNMHNETGNNIDLSRIVSNDIEFCNCREVPIILLGTFSAVRDEFFWRGSVVIQI